MSICVYTDGSCLGNPGPGGLGVRLFFPQKEPHTLQQGYRLTTNNRMELLAVILALEMIPRTMHMSIKVYTDSKYVADAIEKGWLKNWVAKKFKKIKNQDLWQRYLKVAMNLDLSFYWLKGHAGNSENERCDRLAREAAAAPTYIDKFYESIYL